VNILFVTIEPPWPIMGGTPMRSYNLLTRMARRHTVYLACPATASQAATLHSHFQGRVAGIITVPPPAARPLWRRAAGVALETAPDLAYRNYQPQLAHAVANALQSVHIDIIDLVGLEAAGVLMGPRWRPLSARAVVLEAMNAEFQLQERALHVDAAHPSRWVGAAYSWAQVRKLRQYEALACSSATRVTAVSEGDAAVLEGLVPGLHADVVPNGVDTAYYCPAPVPPSGLDVVFSGTMDFRPNVDAVCWFAEAIWPKIRAGAPGARFVIVGRNPSPVVQRLAAADVVVTGAVPEDLPYLQNAAAYVIPMRFGGGSRLKLLQAFSCGLPVVSTTQGADGVRVTPGEHLLVRDDADAFAVATLRVLNDRTLAARLGAAGRARAAEYDWDVVAERLEAAYQAALSTAQPQP
jgi:glycosyltransferase involved in cell wall biosynthesis